MAHSEQVLHGLCPRQQASTLERPASARGMRRAVETSYRHYVVADLASHPSSDPARTHARQSERCSFVAALPLKRPPDARPSDCCLSDNLGHARLPVGQCRFHEFAEALRSVIGHAEVSALGAKRLSSALMTRPRTRRAWMAVPTIAHGIHDGRGI